MKNTVTKEYINRFLQAKMIDTSDPNVKIGSKLPWEDIQNLQTHPIQRDHERRVKKMSKIFANPSSGCHDFTIHNVVEDLTVELVTGDVIEVKKGLYLCDGHTRRTSNRWKEDGKITEGYTPPKAGVNFKIVDIYTPEELLKEYYSIDSSDATEVSGDKIRGAMRILDINLKSNRGKAGTFGSALTNSYPGDVKDSLIDKMAYFKKELELLDEVGMFNPNETELCTQHIIAAGLLSAKLHSDSKDNRNKIKKILTSLSRLTGEEVRTDHNKWNGVTAFIYQSAFPTRKKWYPEEYHKSTKFASWEPVLNFLLYCIELEMTDKKIDHMRGFKTSSWKGKLNETRTVLGNLYKLI